MLTGVHSHLKMSRKNVCMLLNAAECMRKCSSIQSPRLPKSGNLSKTDNEQKAIRKTCWMHLNAAE